MAHEFGSATCEQCVVRRMCRDAHESGTASERGFGAQSRSTGHSRPAADDQDMAEISLVRIRAPWRQQRFNQAVID